MIRKINFLVIVIFFILFILVVSGESINDNQTVDNSTNLTANLNISNITIPDNELITTNISEYTNTTELGAIENVGLIDHNTTEDNTIILKDINNTSTIVGEMNVSTNISEQDLIEDSQHIDKIVENISTINNKISAQTVESEKSEKKVARASFVVYLQIVD